MLKIDQEKMERLFRVEASFSKTLQRLMHLEKEQQSNTQKTQEVLKQLECIKLVENTLIKEIYEEYGMDAIVDYFEEISSKDTLYPILYFQKIFDVKTRVFHLFLEHSYQEFTPLKPREEKILVAEKIDHISDIDFLMHLLKAIGQKVEEHVCIESFTTLKYNIIYTYPILESILFSKQINSLALCFLYHVSYEEASKNIKKFSEAEAQSVISGWVEKYGTEEKITPDMQFEVEKFLAMLKAYLFSVDEFTFYYLQAKFSVLEINPFVRKRVMHLFDEIFDEKLKEKIEKESTSENQYVKKSLLSDIEFYKKR